MCEQRDCGGHFLEKDKSWECISEGARGKIPGFCWMRYWGMALLK